MYSVTYVRMEIHVRTAFYCAAIMLLFIRCYAILTKDIYLWKTIALYSFNIASSLLYFCVCNTLQ